MSVDNAFLHSYKGASALLSVSEPGQIVSFGTCHLSKNYQTC